MKTIRYIAAALAAMLLSLGLAAQNINVSGTVRDAAGEPVIGAGVVADGTMKGAVTDVDGRFTLENVQQDAVLVASALGYVPAKRMAASKVDFVLAADTQMLEETVVVGYGAMKKSNITGAVETVKADKLPKAASASVGNMLRGRAAGMEITQNSATPGGSLNIAIRGGLSGARPLIVIDGVPQVHTNTMTAGTSYSGAAKDTGLSNLNPNDIETIDILKDASAASIYGSDASGGVILITTKRGRSGRPDISYSGSAALQYIKDAPDFMNARDFMIEQNKVWDELKKPNEKKYDQELIDSFVGDGTDWMKEVTRIGIVNEHNLSMSAGTDNTKYLLSLSYLDHQGVAKNNSMNRFTGRVNIAQNIGKRVTVGVSATFAQLKYRDVPLGDARQGDSALIYSAMTFNPTVPVYNIDGSFSDNPDRPNIYPNPVSLLEVTDNTRTRDLFASAYVEYRPFDGFSVKATYGTNIRETQVDQYIPTTTLKGSTLGGQASKQNSANQMNMVNVIANYSKVFGDRHDFSAMAGYEFKFQNWEGMGIVASQFPYDGALMNNMGNSEQEKPVISSWRGGDQMASVIARINYAYDSRYVVTVNARMDGSSNFSPEHQWAVFPGVSLAWRMNNESWMKDISWIADLKLRAGAGQTGNAGGLTGIYSYYNVSQGSFAPDGNISNGITLAKLGNPNLKWETLTDYNVGVDFGFWNNRFYGSIDLYQRDRKDVILTRNLMSYHEIKTMDYNSKEVYRARGIDISLHSVNIDNRNFTWTTDLNFSFYRNSTVRRDPEFIPEPYQDMVETWGNVYGYRTDGLVSQEDAYILPHLVKSGAGAIKYQDLYSYQYDENGEKMRDGDGRYIRVEGADGILDAADIVVLRNSTPIPFSINNTFRWKNWDANIYIYGSLNGWKINEVKYQSVYGIQDLTYGVNALTSVKDRWSLSNPTGTLPSVEEASSGVDPKGSDFFLEKAWYLRLDNISIGYTFPVKKIRSVRLYAAVRNIAVLTPYKGMDPETGNGIGAYPNQASAAIGLDVKF